MRRQYYILLWVILIPATFLHAQQEGREDSIWVANRLEGKDTLRINPEFMRAIQSGTLINTGPEDQQMLLAPAELPILKDFSEYLKADTMRKGVANDSLPPAVFALYKVDSAGQLQIRKEAYTSLKPFLEKDRKKFQIGNAPVYVTPGAQNLFLKEVKDGQRRGSIGVTVTAKFSLEDMLKYVFSKTERNKRKNRKREATWKYYNAYP